MKKVFFIFVVMSSTVFAQQSIGCGDFQSRARKLIVDGQNYLDQAQQNKSPYKNMSLAHSNFFAAQELLKLGCPGSTQAITALGDSINLIEQAIDGVN